MRMGAREHRDASSLTRRPNRIDLVVMPLLILAFFALQIDRGNMYARFISRPFFARFA